MEITELYIRIKIKKDVISESIPQINVDTSNLKEYVGEYETSSMGVVSIILRNDNLVCSILPH